MAAVLAVVLVLTVALAGCGRFPAQNQPADGVTGDHTGGGVGGAFSVDFRNTPSVYMADATVGWAVTRTSVLRTEDGGARWVEVTPNAETGFSLAASALLGPARGWVAMSREGSGTLAIFRTTDGGKSWSGTEVELSNPQCAPCGASFDFVDSDHGWLLVHDGVATGHEAVEIYRTGDGGASWTLAARTETDGQNPDGLPFAGIKTGLSFADTQNGWLTGFDYGPELWLYATHDAGRTWQRCSLPIPQGYTAEGGSAETRPAIFFGSREGILPVVFHARGQHTIFYVTRDGGATWKPTTPIKSAINQEFVWSFPDSKHGFATDGDSLYVTSDGAATWAAVTPDARLAGTTCLYFISPQVGWAVASGTLFRTSDGGHTWVKVGCP
ncbi:MAG: hypothetical protein QME87_08780 [Bacillota bacterium]|nr:hypothetical protein [Bacillota bacterium]